MYNVAGIFLQSQSLHFSGRTATPRNTRPDTAYLSSGYIRLTVFSCLLLRYESQTGLMNVMYCIVQ